MSVDRRARLAARNGMYRTSDRMEHAQGWDGVVRRRPADPVLIADARTSMCDYRIALAQALGQNCDRNGYTQIGCLA